MAGELSSPTVATGRPARSYGALIVAMLGIVVAAGWSIAARMLLSTALEHESERAVQQATQLFDYRVNQTQERVRAECWLMSEDPRLKSALATQGIDESTIKDLLGELAKLSGAQLAAILTPAGRVQAVVGMSEFSGLDFSTSKYVREAREKPEPAGGLWVLGDDLMYVAVHAMRFGDRVVAYFLLGHKIDERSIRDIYAATGAGMSIIAGGKIVRTVPEASAYRAAADHLLASRTTGTTSFTADGQKFFGNVRQVEGALPPAYVVCVRAWGELSSEYEMLNYLLWVPAIVAFALAFLFTSRFLVR